MVMTSKLQALAKRRLFFPGGETLDLQCRTRHSPVLLSFVLPSLWGGRLTSLPEGQGGLPSGPGFHHFPNSREEARLAVKLSGNQTGISLGADRWSCVISEPITVVKGRVLFSDWPGLVIYARPKFSSAHNKKWNRETGEINFHNVFYLTHSVQLLSHVQNSFCDP